jgi:RND family efflux transporter MFP subunit
MYKYIIALALLLASGCQHHQEPVERLDTHVHGDELTQHTLFSHNTEFFIEHGALHSGEESEFLVHATRLDSYKPYTSGMVTLSINGISQSADCPGQPGIFHITMTPGTVGAFDLHISLHTQDRIESCTVQVNVEGHEEDQPEDHDAEHDTEGEITFLKEQAWNSRFMVSQVTRNNIFKVILTSGEVISAPGKINRVGANIGGIVSFSNKNLVPGMQVEKGTHLFTISGKSLPENNFELQYQQASNSLEKSRSEFLRHQKLYARGAISERQLLNSRATYLADSLSYFSLAESTSENGLKVFAPSSGTIHELNVSEGTYIETGQNMLTLSSDRVLLLRADLPQQFHERARDITDANFRLAYAPETFSIADFNGRHLATGQSVAENGHYLPIYFELQNDGRLLEGAFAEIYLKTTTLLERTTIPLTAISEEQGATYVYVQVAGESYSKRAVETGQSDGLKLEILDGLNPGERIVTEGAMLIKAASMVVGPVGDGHSH